MDRFHVWSDQLTLLFFDHDHQWLHLIVHFTLVIMPIILVLILLKFFIGIIKLILISNGENKKQSTPLYSPSIPPSISQFIRRYTFQNQLLIALGALLTIPITFSILELPKLIINNAINSESYTESSTSTYLSQIEYLILLCSFYLVALIANSVLKFFLNVYKGSIAEGLIKRLRLNIFRIQRNRTDQEKSKHLAPVILQEVEPICAFSGDAIAVPLLQGGTVFTIITFMLLQNITLGAAVIALLPIQLIVIPIFQRRINKLVYKRLKEVRSLNDLLTTEQEKSAHTSQKYVRKSFHYLYLLRIELFKTKFIMKSLNNFIMNLTPFFFYTVGGYLVIEGKLSLGALVASLASYKDLSSAIRELFTYYQSLQDARVRYTEMVSYVQSLSANTLLINAQTDNDLFVLPEKKR